MNSRILMMFGLALILAGTDAFAEPLTKSQGDAILKELREIKQLLLKNQEQAPAAPSAPETLKIRGGANFVLGKSDAPLTLVEFTDYQCPFCARFETTTLPDIKRKFIDTGKVKLIMRDFPLEFHPFALKAAQSVRCAGDQGKYWEMRDVLFRNQSKLDVDSLAGYAKDLSLNGETFKSCMADNKHLKEINDESMYVRSLGITGTPTFLLGRSVGDSVEGNKIVGALPLEVFEGAINEMLEKH